MRNELLAVEMLIGIPTNLPSNKDNTARCHADAVGIADRRQPTGRMKNLQ